MKPVIRAQIPADKLPHAVPPAYRDDVRKAAGAEGTYSLLLFAHAPRDVVMSPPVRKALRRLGPPAAAGVLAVGTVFTQEALALLEAAGAKVVAYRKSKWTDESARQRQLKPQALDATAAASAPATVPLPCPPALDDAALHSPACVLAHADAYPDAPAPDDDAWGVAAEPGAEAPQDADHLLRGYAGTDYHVEGLDAPLHPGEPNAALAGFLAGQGARGVAVLTACNPLSEPLPPDENARRQAALRAALEAEGLRCVAARGRARGEAAEDTGEPLLAVFDAPPSVLQRLMDQFGQNAAVIGAIDAAPRLWLRPGFMHELAREEYAAS